MSKADQVQQLINKGRYFEAAQIARKANEDNSDQRLIQLHALAVSKSGAPEEAMQILEPLYQNNPDDPETAGILGGIYKNIFLIDRDPEYGQKSYETYLANYNSTRSYYTGINAATMSTLIGMAGSGRKIAAELIDELDSEDFWQHATKAEALLLTKDHEAATNEYRAVRQRCANDYGKISSIHAQLWLLNHFTKVPGPILDLYKPPTISAFTGHMIDDPNREIPRFPAEIEPRVAEGIRGLIRSSGTDFGFCSLACGSDILFAEAMLAEDKEIAVVLPFKVDDFIKTSVDFAGGNWKDRFQAIINNNQVKLLSNQAFDGMNDHFRFLGEYIMGSAIIRAQLNGTEPNLISVQSEYDQQTKTGGTRDLSNLWPYSDNHYKLDIDSLRNPVSDQNSLPTEHINPERKDYSQVLMCNLVNLEDAEKNSILASMDEMKADMILAPTTFSYGDNRIVFEHSSIRQILDVVDVLLRIPTKKLAVSLHSEISDRVLLNKIGGEILQEDPQTNSVIATGNLAVQVVLERRDYHFSFAGRLERDVDYDLYRMTRK